MGRTGGPARLWRQGGGRQSAQDETALDGSVISHEGLYKQLSAELDIDALAVNTLLQSQAVQELEGTAGTVAFDAAPRANIEKLLAGRAYSMFFPPLKQFRHCQKNGL